MPTVRATDLVTRLTQHAAESVRKADANGTGILTTTEEQAAPASVRDELAQYRKNAGTVRVESFVSAFENYARQAVALADKNKDGLVTELEQRDIYAPIAANVKDALRTASAPSQPTTPTQPSQPSRPTTPSQPTTPTRPSTSAKAFGIEGTIPASRVTLKTVLAQGLNKPSAVAFNPHDGSMWIVNRGDDSSVVIDGVTTAQPRARKYADDSAHFMNNPMAIAFSPVRNEFVTVQETENDYNGRGKPDQFMGPTLFTADRKDYDGGAQSHLDMLHHSPNAMGAVAGAKTSLAADKREYWVFNGQAGSVDRYLFGKPHALGAHDHSDGITVRYGTGELRRTAGIPSGMVLDEKTQQLFIADTGNGRIVKLDTRTDLSTAKRVRAHHDETPLHEVPGARLAPVATGLRSPSAMILKDDLLIVAEHGTGQIKVFSKDGKLQGSLDTGMGAGALTGLAASPDGKLFALDSRKNQLVEVQVRA